ncbi:MAG: hypothetical protein R3A78_01875 [Polyangiales bacterium]
MLFFVVLSGGALVAAEGPREDADVGSARSGTAEIPIQSEAVLSAAEQLAEADRIHGETRDTVTAVRGALARARKDADAVLVVCLEDKATLADGYLRTLDVRVPALRAASDAGNALAREHEFTVIGVVGVKVRVVRRDAEACVGEGLLAAGALKVATFVAPGTPLDDASTAQAIPDLQIPFVPPPATGAM